MNLPELPNPTCIVVICWVLNGNDYMMSRKLVEALDTDVMYCKELMNFINRNGGLIEPSIVPSMLKCTLEQNILEAKYVGLYTHEQMLSDPIYRQISYNWCISNAFKLNV